MRHLLAILPLLLLHPVYADSPRVSLRHLTGAVYVVEDFEYAKTNSVVYIGPKAVTVIGATWSPATAKILAGAIRKITNEPIREVVNNDYNPEYVGGNAYWKSIGAKIISTKLTYDLLKTDWTSAGDLIRKYYPDYPHVPLVLPTKTHAGSFSLQGGRIKALYLGPSHTPDDIFVYFPREKVLYAGGILKEHLGNMAFANVGKYETTLHKLQQLHLDIVTVISGHWSAVHGSELISQYLAMLKSYAENKH